jgi:hypothetical protein
MVVMEGQQVHVHLGGVLTTSSCGVLYSQILHRSLRGSLDDPTAGVKYRPKGDKQEGR